MQMGVKVVPMKTVEAELDRYYGMYRSGDLQWARIRFAGAASKIASQVVWHPDQMELWLKDDLYELTIPYSGNSRSWSVISCATALLPKWLNRKV